MPHITDDNVNIEPMENNIIDFVHYPGLYDRYKKTQYVILNQHQKLIDALKVIGVNDKHIFSLSEENENIIEKNPKFLDYHLYNCPYQALINWTRTLAQKGAISFLNYIKNTYKEDSSLLDEKKNLNNYVLICSGSVASIEGKMLSKADNIDQAKTILKDIYKCDY